MPGKVIKVGRRERLDWVQRLYLPAILKGLWTTNVHFFQNFWGYIVGRKRTFVVEYPEQPVGYADAFRGHPVLVALESGAPKCVACGLCEFACPTDCISIIPAETEDAIERYPEEFDIELSRCMFCGLCEEACPEEAIVMSDVVELASLERSGSLYRKKDLLRTEEELDKRLGFIRKEYARP